MKKALTIYIDDDAELIRICGTFLVESDKMSVNFVNEVAEGCNAVYLPNKATKENPIKFFKEVKQ